MFIVLTERKRRRQPLHISKIPVVGFLNRKGRPVSFHKGWYLSPVILEADYFRYLEALLPAYKPHKAPPKARKTPVKHPVVSIKGWQTTSEILKLLEEEYPDYAIGDKACRFHGFVRQSSTLFNLSVWDKPFIPKKAFNVEGFNLFVMVKPKKISPTVDDHDPFLLCGAVVKWQGSITTILKRIYGHSPVSGDTIQSTVPYRTILESLSMNFFSGIGQPVKLVGVQFRTKFNRLERSRIAHLRKRRQRFYTKNPKGGKKNGSN
jgi:hypothetical protein